MSVWKLGRLTPNGEEHEHVHPNVWARERTTGADRLAITAADSLRVIHALLDTLPEPFGVLYVLLVSRAGHEPGRYQNAVPASRAEVGGFLRAHGNFIAHDGRHHVWFMSLPAQASVVYDNHNVVYAYGDLEGFITIVSDLGLAPGAVEIPAPHVHRYNPEFDASEGAVLEYWNWRRFPLADGDDP